MRCVAFAWMLVACRKDAPADAAPSDARSEPVAMVSSEGRPAREGAVDAASQLDTIDATCNGNVDLERAITDPRCAIGVERAKVLRADDKRGGKLPLGQRARFDGDRILFELVNIGTTPLSVPLSWAKNLPSFSIVAEDGARALYELEPPKLAPTGSDERPHFARIVLSPGASAAVRVAPSAIVASRLAPACEAGPCGPARLPPGTYVLHIGQLFSDLEAGAPASVVWEVR